MGTLKFIKKKIAVLPLIRLFSKNFYYKINLIIYKVNKRKLTRMCSKVFDYFVKY